MSVYNVLYTHQKQKKAKVWQDGTMVVLDSCKRAVYNDKKSKIDLLFSNKQVEVGDEYETEKFLILVDSEVSQQNSSSTKENTTPPPTISKPIKPVSSLTNRLSIRSRKEFKPPQRVITVKKTEEQFPKQPPIEKSTSTSLFSSFAHNSIPEKGRDLYPTRNYCPTSDEKDNLNMPAARTRYGEGFERSHRYEYKCGLFSTSLADITDPDRVTSLGLVNGVVADHGLTIHKAGDAVQRDFQANNGCNDLLQVGDKGLREDPMESLWEKPKEELRESSKSSLWDAFLSQNGNPDMSQTDSEQPDDYVTSGGINMSEQKEMKEYFDFQYTSGQTRVELPCEIYPETPNIPRVTIADKKENVYEGCDDKKLLQFSNGHQNMLSAAARPSPQTPNFSLGSLSNFADAAESQEEGSCWGKTRQLLSPYRKTSLSLEENTKKQCTAELLASETKPRPLQSIDSLCAEIPYGLEEVEQHTVTSTPPSQSHTRDTNLINCRSPQRKTNLIDIIREDNSSELDDTSLFELDESRNDRTSLSRVTSDNGDLNVNKWSLFTTPPCNTKKPMKTKSIFEESPRVDSANSACDTLNDSLLNSSADNGLYRATQLVPPSFVNNTSVFGAKLPEVKIQQAKRRTESSNHSEVQAAAKVKVVDCQLAVDSWTLRFPPCPDDVTLKPTRNMVVPTMFKNTMEYRQVMEQLLREHINIMLLEVSKRYHTALSRVDVSINPSEPPCSVTASNSKIPVCSHGIPANIQTVKKPGANNGRRFYCCSQPRGNHCKFFKWVEDAVKSVCQPASQSLRLDSSRSLEEYLNSKEILFYCSVKLKKSSEVFIAKKSWAARNDLAKSQSSSLYLLLTRKEKASNFTKDDLWVLSQSMKFDLSGNTFLAKSAFYGPNSANEVELVPIAGYSSCNWPDGTECHAIHVANISTELACLYNVHDLSARTMPVLPWLIHPSGPERNSTNFEVPRKSTDNMLLPEDFVALRCEVYIEKYKLNEGQAEALKAVASTLVSSKSPLCLIKGVFGAGKSYLLSVIVLFLIEMLSKIDSYVDMSEVNSNPSKIMIASMTNVAVDRILISLLDHNYAEFIRVGSLKKISKRILPYSLHTSGNANAELKELNELMKDPSMSSSEKQCVKKTLDKHKMGVSKQLLSKVRVVGVTCAACTFPVLDNLSFKVVLLDECSQMSEPLSLLPVKRAQCNKLVLVGDPKQLNPTIQSSSSPHEHGLEQTLFDRLSLMGLTTASLITQYRCHPDISELCRRLFYEGVLKDGVMARQRPPLIENLPAICLYDVCGNQEYSGDMSLYNSKEADFVYQLVVWMTKQGVSEDQIGVITLYKAQMFKVSALLTKYRKVRVATVDSFQGGEKDVIVLSSVRTDQMGFVDDSRRTNVALSRAKHHLLIVGSMENLNRNHLWRQIVSYLQGKPQGIIPGATQLRHIKAAMQKEREGFNSVKRSVNIEVDGIDETEVLSKRIKSGVAESRPPEDTSTHYLESSPTQVVDSHNCEEEDGRCDSSLPLDLSDEEFLTQFQKTKNLS